MNTSTNRREDTRVVVPPELKVFLALAAAVMAFELLVFTEPFHGLNDATARFNSLIGAMPYMFALVAWLARLQRGRVALDVMELRSYLKAQCVALGTAALFGVVEFFVVLRLQDPSDPWSRYSPWRPLLTVAAPIAWCVVLWRARERTRAVVETR